MRTIIKIIVVLILGSIGLCGCKKSSTPIPAGFSLKLNNVLWIPKNYTATGYYSNPNSLEIDMECSDSVNGPSLAIGLTMSSSTATPGIFTCGSRYCSMEYFDQKTIPLNYIECYDGVITVTKAASNNIQGTFHGTFGPMLTITDGTFNVTYQ